MQVDSQIKPVDRAITIIKSILINGLIDLESIDATKLNNCLAEFKNNGEWHSRGTIYIVANQLSYLFPQYKHDNMSGFLFNIMHSICKDVMNGLDNPALTSSYDKLFQTNLMDVAMIDNDCKKNIIHEDSKMLQPPTPVDRAITIIKLVLIDAILPEYRNDKTIHDCLAGFKNTIFDTWQHTATIRRISTELTCLFPQYKYVPVSEVIFDMMSRVCNDVQRGLNTTITNYTQIFRDGLAGVELRDKNSVLLISDSLIPTDKSMPILIDDSTESTLKDVREYQSMVHELIKPLIDNGELVNPETPQGIIQRINCDIKDIIKNANEKLETHGQRIHYCDVTNTIDGISVDTKTFSVTRDHNLTFKLTKAPNTYRATHINGLKIKRVEKLGGANLSFAVESRAPIDGLIAVIIKGRGTDEVITLVVSDTQREGSYKRIPVYIIEM
jgi:hypothetical protein